MKFQAAYSYMKNGHPITLPEWGGYWEWDKEEGTIQMRLRDGNTMDLRETDKLDYTMSFMFRDDWELVSRVKETEHFKNRGKPANVID